MFNTTINTELHPTHVLLLAGMTTQDGDEHYYGNDRGGWVKAIPGYIVRSWQVFRRPITSPWRSVNDPPEDQTERVFLSGGGAKTSAFPFENRNLQRTHWMRIPAMPEQPNPTPEELSRAAFDAGFPELNITNYPDALYLAWLGGEKYGRGQA